MRPDKDKPQKRPAHWVEPRLWIGSPNPDPATLGPHLATFLAGPTPHDAAMMAAAGILLWRTTP
jgi:hypothetical protein